MLAASNALASQVHAVKGDPGRHFGLRGIKTVVDPDDLPLKPPLTADDAPAAPAG